MVLGGVSEAKILDFRTFFDVFLMSFFEQRFGRPKNRKKAGKNKKDCDFGSARRNVRSPGER